MNILVFTDGSCIGQGKGTPKCGIGIHFPNKELADVSKKFKLDPLTNQRAELYAIYYALRKIIKNLDFKTITILTDSEYSIKSLTVWVKDWEKKDWKNAQKKPVMNQDLIKPIYEIIKKHKDNIKFIHVDAHTGGGDWKSVGNALVDRLAKQGALSDD